MQKKIAITVGSRDEPVTLDFVASGDLLCIASYLRISLFLKSEDDRTLYDHTQKAMPISINIIILIQWNISRDSLWRTSYHLVRRTRVQLLRLALLRDAPISSSERTRSRWWWRLVMSLRAIDVDEESIECERFAAANGFVSLQNPTLQELLAIVVQQKLRPNSPPQSARSENTWNQRNSNSIAHRHAIGTRSREGKKNRRERDEN